MKAQSKYGVLLVNTGTPAAPKPSEVRKFLSEFLMNKRIAPMNRAVWWLILHLFILPSRGRKSAEKYASIWTDEGSPLLIAQGKLVGGLQKSLKEAGFVYTKVEGAMSFGKPSIIQALKGLKKQGCEKLLVLPLYPQSAYSTTGVVHDGVKEALEKIDWDVDCHLIENYHDDPTYTRAIAASLRHAGFNADSPDKVLFSFHSIPLVDIEAGDTYELQCGASSLQIASELAIDRKQWTIGYQCRFDKNRQWLSPFTKEVLDRWAEAKVGRIFVVCPNFAVDCLETIYDVDYEMRRYYAQACREHGATPKREDFIYVPCLDKSKAHLKVLKDVVSAYLEE